MNTQAHTQASTDTALPTVHVTTASDTSSSSIVIVATPSVVSIEPEDERERDMDTAQDGSGSASSLKAQEQSAPAIEVGSEQAVGKKGHGRGKAKKSAKHEKKPKHAKSRKSKKAIIESSSEDSSSESEESVDSSISDDDSSDDQRERRKKLKKKAAKEKEKKKGKAKAKAKAVAKKRKSKKHDSSSEDSYSNSDSDSAASESSSSSSSSSSSESDSESEQEKKRRKKKTKAKNLKARRPREAPPESESSTEAEPATEVPTTASTPSPDQETEEQLTTQLGPLLANLIQKQMEKQMTITLAATTAATETVETEEKEKKKKKRSKDKNKYKRVDHVWDNKLRDWKITDSAEKKQEDVDSVFTVRRTFTWENQYNGTLVDIQSSILQEALQEILKDVKGLSLVDETPAVDPNLFFLYHDEIKTYFKKTLKTRMKREKKRKQKKHLARKIAQVKLLSNYIDKDYEPIRKRLHPMLKAGNITWDLIWALFKPSTIAYSHTYGNKDDPRCFRADFASKERNFMGEEWWTIEGRYLEYDGTTFGLGDHAAKIEPYKGTRKISSLAAYPLSYHKDPEGLRKTLIERGKKFIALQGMNYRFHTGLAYQKVKRSIVKHNIDSRVMVDPAIFRRINPNYPLSYIKSDGQDDDDDEEQECCDCSDSGEESEEEERPRIVIFKDKKGKYHLAEIPAGGSIADLTSQKLESVEKEDGSTHTFTEEELLIASPVVLGFSFSEKLWLEFSLSGIKEITWNSTAFDSLVLPSHIKQNLKGLVSSHRFNAAKTIDDVIQGKGKGLNVVLHGPPGVGKTLTAESIADFLKCPLYAVSAGELGTNSRTLEADLNRITEITHSWGAILLLDEADVFLEQRQAQDIHRNALVSVFLRLLEYYQGILFLTTNRVETFDEAFQSRIHMGIRYENLTAKARREIWQHHVRKLEALKDQESIPLIEADYEQLSKKALNGRQIRIAVSTAQSIALVEEKPFSIEFIKRYLEVNEDFQTDMRGGSGHANLYT